MPRVKENFYFDTDPDTRSSRAGDHSMGAGKTRRVKIYTPKSVDELVKLTPNFQTAFHNPAQAAQAWDMYTKIGPIYVVATAEDGKFIVQPARGMWADKYDEVSDPSELVSKYPELEQLAGLKEHFFLDTDPDTRSSRAGGHSMGAGKTRRVKIYTPKSVDELVKLTPNFQTMFHDPAKGARAWDMYTRNGPIYVVATAEDGKFIVQPAKGMWADKYDRISDPSELVSKYPELEQLAGVQESRRYRVKENYVKQLRTLLESEVDEAEIIIAIKGIGKTLQEMIEKIGRLQNEDLPPLSDQVRETYGPNIASNFHDMSSSSLQNVLDSLYSAKDETDEIVTKMASGAGDLVADVDMDVDIPLGGDNDMGSDMDDALDDFAGDPAASGPEDEPLGRSKKESVETMKKKISEMKTKIAKAKALKARA